MEIKGKVFIVTGGASGLGEGAARMLADAGAIDEAEELARPGRLGDHPLAVGLLADVAADETTADLGGDGGASLVLQIGDHHRRTGTGKHARRAFAEPGRSARDDEYLALDLHVFSFRRARRERAR